MHLEVSFRNLRARDEVKARAQVLYAKFERFLDPSAEGHLVVTVEHNKAIMELVVKTAGETHTANEEDDDLKAALDKVFHTMELRLRRSKEKRIARQRQSVPPADGFAPVEPDLAEQ